MSKICAICAHKNRDQIDKLILQKTPYRTIAKQFRIKGKDPTQTIRNHVRYNHVSQKIKKAQESEEVRSGLELQACAQEIYDLCLGAARTAKEDDLRAFGSCIGPAIKVLEFLKVPEKPNAASQESPLLLSLKSDTKETFKNDLPVGPAQPQPEKDP